jgi:hypothetical protein
VAAYSDAGERRIDGADAMNPLPGLIQLFTSFWLWSVVGLLSLAFSWLVLKIENRMRLVTLRMQWLALIEVLLSLAIDRHEPLLAQCGIHKPDPLLI